MAFQIQLRRGTASEWTAANPTLAAGELGFESDTSKLKIGDGLTAWTSLSYFTAGTSLGTMTGIDITAGNGLDITQSNTSSGNYTATVSADLKSNGGIVVESTELAVDLGASAITGTLAVSDGGTGLSSISTLLNSNTTKSDVGLGNVENTALTGWPGSGSITQVGTISSGTWSGTAIAYSSLSGKPSLGTASQYNAGIASNNILQANAAVVDNDFLRIDGTKVEGRSASEVLSDIGAAASSHNHAAGDITSGTLAVARGGTGSATAPMVGVITAANAAAARSILGVGTGAGDMVGSNNLSEITNESTARTNLGLGTAATSATGDFAAAAHNQSAATITSGTLAVARGGTGLTSLSTLLNSNQAYSDISGTPTLGTAAAAATGDFEASGSITTHNAITTAHGISTFGATLVDDASATDARTTLGAAASNHSHSIGQITGAGTAAALDVGITSNDVLQVSTSGVTANEFLRVEALGTKVISRTAAEVLTDIGAQASLTAPVTSPAMTGVSAGSITGVIKCSQSQYDAISHDANTAKILYVIV